MQPHNYHVKADKSDVRWFVWEKCGLEIGVLGGYTEKEDEDDIRDGAEQDGETAEDGAMANNVVE